MADDTELIAELQEAGFEDEVARVSTEIMGEVMGDFLTPDAKFINGQITLLNGRDFNSSNVEEMWYDFRTASMFIRYRSGGTYRYWPVTGQEARDFYEAASKGTKVWDIFRVRGSATEHKKSYAKVA